MIYRSEDLDTLNKNIDQIAIDAEKLYNNNYAIPTVKQYKDVQSVILNYIKKNNKIIYGGFAHNLLIKNKNKNDGIYNDSDKYDVEFYSTTPIKDVIELTEILYKEGFKNIQGKEAVHDETYTIKVEFETMCDITYMDEHIFNNCPTIVIDKLNLVHPYFYYVDAFRIYSDLLTSNFRLNKQYTRTNKLFKYYPFDEKLKYNKIKINGKILDDIKRYIRKNIIHNSDLIVVGIYCYNYMVKKYNNKEELEFPYYELISSNLNEDFKKILDILKKKFKKDISYSWYYHFFQFWDKNVEFYYKGNLVLKLYGNNEKCIVFNYSKKKKTNFGSFQLLNLFLLSNYNYSLINKKKDEMVYLSLLVKIYNIRNKYFEKKKLGILDNTVFKEFTYDCKGKVIDTMREHLLRGQKRKENKQRLIFSYTPPQNLITIPIKNFTNRSGLKIPIGEKNNNRQNRKK